MNKSSLLALGALIAGVGFQAVLADTDCFEIYVEVKRAAAAQPASVLEIVERQVGANPNCACEVVKAAIESTKADSKTVAAIVETAAQIAPDQMRLISQCAAAVAPDALQEVQRVMAGLEPAWNPLNFPGVGVGPTPGSSGGFSLLPPAGLPPGRVTSLLLPPIIEPQVATPTDFGNNP